MVNIISTFYNSFNHLQKAVTQKQHETSIFRYPVYIFKRILSPLFLCKFSEIKAMLFETLRKILNSSFVLKIPEELQTCVCG